MKLSRAEFLIEVFAVCCLWHFDDVSCTHENPSVAFGGSSPYQREPYALSKFFSKLKSGSTDFSQSFLISHASSLIPLISLYHNILS